MDKHKKVTRRGEGDALQVMGAELRFLCSAEATGKGWSVMEATLPHEAGPPLHEHPWDEGYYVLEGALRFTLGDEVIEAAAGDFLYAPGGTPHAFAGASEQPARVLIFDAPAAAEGFFRDVDREVKEFPRDADKIPEIGQRHGLHFIR